MLIDYHAISSTLFLIQEWPRIKSEVFVLHYSKQTKINIVNTQTIFHNINIINVNEILKQQD